jgi:hypothetical protein
MASTVALVLADTEGRRDRGLMSWLPRQARA